ncbi:MAG: hypothetical protein LUC44_06935 [Prevotellaceae bacterium]|nr:hypothetical protein [Prevotellaceae bacterium]
MKKLLFTTAVAFGFACALNAMDYETARDQAYYLTDKMAYELNLNDDQYNDAFEKNLDYLLALNDESDIDAAYLEYRNADLRYILYDWQWAAFIAADYFLHPVYWLSGGWYFPIFRYYAHGYFFFDRPGVFLTYRGAHGHAHYLTRSFYANRRPAWNGGLRGRSQSMVGHPNGSNGGRYGTPGAGRGNTSAQRNTGNRAGSNNTNRGSNSSVGANRGSNAGSRNTGTTTGNSRNQSTSNNRNTGTTAGRSTGTVGNRGTSTTGSRSTGSTSISRNSSVSSSQNSGMRSSSRSTVSSSNSRSTSSVGSGSRVGGTSTRSGGAGSSRASSGSSVRSSGGASRSSGGGSRGGGGRR